MWEEWHNGKPWSPLRWTENWFNTILLIDTGCILFVKHFHNDNDNDNDNDNILSDHNVQIEFTMFNSLENQVINWSGDSY